jgi:hypothetical protein
VSTRSHTERISSSYARKAAIIWKETLETANDSREAPYSFLGETPCEHRVTPCPLDYLPRPESILPGGTGPNSAYAHPVGAIVSARRPNRPRPARRQLLRVLRERRVLRDSWIRPARANGAIFPLNAHQTLNTRWNPHSGLTLWWPDIWASGGRGRACQQIVISRVVEPIRTSTLAK